MADLYVDGAGYPDEGYERDDMEAEVETKPNAFEFLARAVQSNNLVPDLEGTQLQGIGHRVVSEYEIDRKSRHDWEERTEAAVKLAMLVAEQKNYPFERASNIKYPLLTTAALQFNARSYPAIVQGNRVAKCQTWGRDPQGLKAARADRVSEFLSYQLLSLPEWEEDTDKMLVMLPIVGCMFRKVYYDPALRRNCTRLISPDKLVVNYHARSLEDTPRATEQMHLYPYEIEERIRSNRFVDFKYEGAQADEDQKEADSQDDDAPHLFLEQHRLIDLDDDGYPEPYVVTVHKPTSTVVRIVANFRPETVQVEGDKVISIRKQDYYVKYLFLPSPDGGFYGWGFGWLLKDIGESVNTTLNQMLDAGHLSNVQGGLVSASVGIKEKSIRLKPGEWRIMNTSAPLKDSILPLTYPGPSATLFQLLGMLIEAGKEVAAVKDVLTGDTPANAPVGTTLALIEQGLQVFTSIYKRVHRAIKAELGLHARLNRDHLDPERYNAFFDDQETPLDPAADFSEDDMDILPVSDPGAVSKMQTLQKAMFVLEMADKDIATPAPVMDRREAMLRVLEAAQVEEAEKLIPPPPPPNPEEELLKRIMAMLAIKGQEADILQKQTTALRNVADAEAKEEGTQLDALVALLQQLQSKMEGENGQTGQGRVRGMEGQPDNAGGGIAPAGTGAVGQFAAQANPAGLDGGSPAGLGLPATEGGL